MEAKVVDVPKNSNSLGIKLKPSLIVLSSIIFIQSLPIPDGLTKEAWLLVTIFIGTLTAILTKPLPIGAVGFVSLATCLFIKPTPGLNPLKFFSSEIVWLIFSAFILAKCFLKTGLGNRVSYILIAKFGGTRIGLAYAICLAELILAPLIPSNSARGAGIIFPIVSSIHKQYEAKEFKNLTKFLIMVAFQANLIVSAMFLTAMAANPFIVGVVSETCNINITWLMWTKYAILPGLANLALMPLLLVKILKLPKHNLEEVPDIAKKELTKIGNISKDETILLGCFLGLIALWIFGGAFNISSGAVAVFGVATLLLFGVISWDEILKEKQAWDTMLWLGLLLYLSAALNHVGITNWISTSMQVGFATYDYITVLVGVCAVYYFSHYAFASMTAHVSAMYGTFLAIAVSLNAPPLLSALALGYLSSLCAGTTHYGTGTAPAYFGVKSFSVSKWWLVSGSMSMVNVMVWIFVGLPWAFILQYV